MNVTGTESRKYPHEELMALSSERADISPPWVTRELENQAVRQIQEDTKD